MGLLRIKTMEPTRPSQDWMTQAEEDGRFRFGWNWRRFVEKVGVEHIRKAEDALAWWFPGGGLAGRSFLDAGSGSGLSSLAAVRLGAARVHSFDFDPESVASTSALRARFSPDASGWTIEQGSLLDEAYLRSLGQWDVVYSWGVVHHTGAMWGALDRLSGLVSENGKVLVAVYNDQGLPSRLWWRVKRLYNSGYLGRVVVLALGLPGLAVGGVFHDLARGRSPVVRYRAQERGMTALTDWIDWLGGYPFEFAKPDAVTRFFGERGLQLERDRTVGNKLGCNEFLFRK